MFVSRGRVSARVLIFGDKKARVDATESQPGLFNSLKDASLGQSGSSADCIPRKEMVSEDTSPLITLPTCSSATRPVYALNRSHSSVVGVLIKRWENGEWVN